MSPTSGSPRGISETAICHVVAAAVALAGIVAVVAAVGDAGGGAGAADGVYLDCTWCQS